MMQNELRAKEILSKHNADLQRQGNGVLSWDYNGYAFLIKAMLEYGQEMAEAAVNEYKKNNPLP